MNRLMNNFSLLASRVNRRHIQFFLVILYLTLFVLGAGAPMAEGDVGV